MSEVPWGVFVLAQLIGPANCTTMLQSGYVVRAVPEPYSGNLFERVRAAWWVLTGRAQAVVWPEPGELERALQEQRG